MILVPSLVFLYFMFECSPEIKLRTLVVQSPASLTFVCCNFVFQIIASLNVVLI